ncbi:MAG TPA: YggS family pyridoxal phosphate-dependent enzyme [Chloroflexi bacterium]|jgi:pyridoxal phosphate enzyme (YggS family)|nr:YggS family pyridoxal phosphate-dependent enzyme [Chloroflexota bacterium]
MDVTAGSGTIAENLARVEARIEAACRRAGRRRDEVTLVAVSKTHTPAEILDAYRCGVRHLGENRVEEAEEKVPALRDEWPGEPPRWHFIGHVQSRKARRVVAVADIVHSVDSVRLAGRLDRYAAEAGRRLPVLVQMNVSGEASKGGFCAWDDAHRREMLAQIGALADLKHLEVRGLMTMAPIVPDPEDARPVFRALAALRDMLRRELPYTSWDDLSMGMTDDFEVAIEEGATLVRIGRAIFGPRL